MTNQGISSLPVNHLCAHTYIPGLLLSTLSLLTILKLYVQHVLHHTLYVPTPKSNFLSESMSMTVGQRGGPISRVEVELGLLDVSPDVRRDVEV